MVTAARGGREPWTCSQGPSHPTLWFWAHCLRRGREMQVSRRPREEPTLGRGVQGDQQQDPWSLWEVRAQGRAQAQECILVTAVLLSLVPPKSEADALVGCAVCRGGFSLPGDRVCVQSRWVPGSTSAVSQAPWGGDGSSVHCCPHSRVAARSAQRDTRSSCTHGQLRARGTGTDTALLSLQLPVCNLTHPGCLVP